MEKSGETLTLSNGLISRVFTLTPDFGTVDFQSLTEENSILRAISPEAFITINGIQYAIGGLEADVKHSYLNRSSLTLTVNPNAYHYVSYSLSSPEAPFHWEPGLRHSPPDALWPPKGLTLNVKFVSPNASKAMSPTIYVHYEMYQGAPILAKWVSVEYDSLPIIVIDQLTVEYLPTQKPYAPLSFEPTPRPWAHGPGTISSWLYVNTSSAHGASVEWISDPQISLSPGADEPVLKCSYELGLGVIMGSLERSRRTGGGTPLLTEFDSFKVLELVTDSAELERVGLSRHRMTRLLTPQTQENPIFFQATNTTPAGFKAVIDQMVEVGFEMYIYSFGSGFNIESTSSEFIKEIAMDIAYAKQKGIEVGG